MKNSALILFLAALLAAPHVAVYASEEGKPAKEESAKKPEKEGEHGGGDHGGGGHEGGEGKDKGKKDDKAVSGGRFVGDPIYVHLAPMILPVITDNGAEQIVTMQIDLRVKNFDAADTMHDNMPRLMDSLMQTLYGGLGQGALRNGMLVDVPKVKEKVASALEKTMGPNLIEEVLIQAVAQRRL